MELSWRHSVGLLLFALALGTGASAQKSEPSAVQPPQQAPGYSAADLAAKVPSAKSDDVKSMEAI